MGTTGGGRRIIRKPLPGGPAVNIFSRKLGTLFNNGDGISCAWDEKTFSPEAYLHTLNALLDLKPGVLAQCVGPSLDREPSPFIFPGIYYPFKPLNASCRELGLDVKTWIKDGLVDFVCHTFNCNSPPVRSPRCAPVGNDLPKHRSLLRFHHEQSVDREKYTRRPEYRPPPFVGR